ncbi:MAG TPA: hypothetical protein VN541_13230, partial [Tepidisphaeraceae bacterium]|nr:hypothetical protein [Tepidisphaeraceae bacterium]
MGRNLPSYVVTVVLFSIGAGCASQSNPAPHPSVAPATQPSASLSLNPSTISPMYRELLAIDLPTVVRVANARNLDIQHARQQVEANRGRYESNVEAIFPVIAPSIAYAHFQGRGQNANGTLTIPVHFDNLLPAVSIQWILNPGMVVYDI